MLFNGFKFLGWNAPTFKGAPSCFEKVIVWVMPFFSDVIAPQPQRYFYPPAFKQKESFASSRGAVFSANRDFEQGLLYLFERYGLLPPKKPESIAPKPLPPAPVEKPAEVPLRVIATNHLQLIRRLKIFLYIPYWTAVVCSIGLVFLILKKGNVHMWHITSPIKNALQRRSRKKVLKKLRRMVCQEDLASLKAFIQKHITNNNIELMISELMVLARQVCRNNDLAAVKTLIQLDLWPPGLSVEQYFDLLEKVAPPQKMEFFSFFYDHHCISDVMLASSNAWGESSLHIAVRNRDVALAQCICQHFPQALFIPISCSYTKLDDFGITGDTALHYAVRTHDQRFIELFLEISDEALQVKNSQGESPLQMILEKAFKERRCNEGPLPLPGILPELISVMEHEKVWRNIFYWAIQNDCTPLAQCLIQMIPNAKNNAGYFPPHGVVKNNQTSLLEHLYLLNPEVLFFPTENQPNLLAWLIAHQKFDLFNPLFDWARQTPQLDIHLPTLFFTALQQEDESILSLISSIFFERALYDPELARYIPKIFSSLLTKEKGAQFFQFIQIAELRKWAQSEESTVVEKVIDADHLPFLEKLLRECPCLISEKNLQTGQNALHFSASQGKFHCFYALAHVAKPHDFVMRDAQDQTVLMLFLQQAIQALEKQCLKESWMQAGENSDDWMSNGCDVKQFSPQQVVIIKKLFALHAHHDPFFQTLSEQLLHFGLKRDLPDLLKLFFSNEKITIDWKAMIDHRSLLEHLIQKKNSGILLMALNHRSFKPQLFFLKEKSKNTFAEKILDLAIEKNEVGLAERILPSGKKALQKDKIAGYIDFARQRDGEEHFFLFSAFKKRRLDIFKKILRYAPIKVDDFQQNNGQRSPLLKPFLGEENRDYLLAIMERIPLLWNIQDSNGNSLLHLVLKARGRQLVQLCSISSAQQDSGSKKSSGQKNFNTFLQWNAPAWIEELFFSNHFIWKLSDKHLDWLSQEVFQCLRAQHYSHLGVHPIKKLDWNVQNKQGESALSILFNTVLLEQWACKRFFEVDASERAILNGSPLGNAWNRLSPKVAKTICFKEFLEGYQRFLDHDSDICFSHKGSETLQNFFEPECSCNLFLLLGGLRSRRDNTIFSILTPKQRRELYLLAARLNQVCEALSRSFLYNDFRLFSDVWDPIFDQSPLSVFSDEFSLNGLDNHDKEAIYQLFLEGKNPLGHHDGAIIQLKQLFETVSLEALEYLLKGYPQILRIKHSHLRQNALNFAISSGNCQRLMLIVANLPPQEKNFQNYQALLLNFLKANGLNQDAFIPSGKVSQLARPYSAALDCLLFLPTYSSGQHVNAFIIDCLLEGALTHHCLKLFQRLYWKFITQIDLEKKCFKNQSVLECIVNNHYVSFIESMLTVFEKHPIDSTTSYLEALNQSHIIRIMELLKKKPINNSYPLWQKAIFQDCPHFVQFIIEKADWMIKRLSLPQEQALLQNAVKHNRTQIFKALLNSTEFFASLAVPNFSCAASIIRFSLERQQRHWIEMMMKHPLFDWNTRDNNDNTFVHFLFYYQWFELFYMADPESFSTLNWDMRNLWGVSPITLWTNLLADQLYDSKCSGLTEDADKSGMKYFLFHQLKNIDALNDVRQILLLFQEFLGPIEGIFIQNQSIDPLLRGFLRLLKIKNQFGQTIKEFAIQRTAVEANPFFPFQNFFPNVPIGHPESIIIEEEIDSLLRDFSRSQNFLTSPDVSSIWRY